MRGSMFAPPPISKFMLTHAIEHMYDRGMATGTLERLEDRLADLCGHRNVLDALLVRLVAEALETGGWEMHGIVSPAHWIAWKAGLSSAHAQQLVTVARRRDELPVTFAAFDAGELSLDQVVPIATRAPRWADAELCEFAKLATVTQLRRVLRSYDFPPDPTDRRRPARRAVGSRWSCCRCGMATTDAGSCAVSSTPTTARS